MPSDIFIVVTETHFEFMNNFNARYLITLDVPEMFHEDTL